jgi:hypothetical protein
MELSYICVCLLLHYFYPEGGPPEDRGVRETESGKSLCLQLYVKLSLPFVMSKTSPILLTKVN